VLNALTAAGLPHNNNNPREKIKRFQALLIRFWGVTNFCCFLPHHYHHLPLDPLLTRAGQERIAWALLCQDEVVVSETALWMGGGGGEVIASVEAVGLVGVTTYSLSASV